MKDLFPIGTRVVVITSRWDDHREVQYGAVGEVTDHFHPECSDIFDCKVQLEGFRGERFYKWSDIQPAGGPW